MKKRNIDFFKISIILILLGFLYCFYQFTLNGRYVNTADFRVVLDSKTGRLNAPDVTQKNK